MEKSNLHLLLIVIVLVFTNLYLVSQVDLAFMKARHFTYEDGVALYNICQKNGGNKDTLIKRIYEDKNTDFKEFIL